MIFLFLFVLIVVMFVLFMRALLVVYAYRFCGVCVVSRWVYLLLVVFVLIFSDFVLFGFWVSNLVRACSCLGFGFDFGFRCLCLLVCEFCGLCVVYLWVWFVLVLLRGVCGYFRDLVLLFC